jgi:hypothetical protein
MVGFDNSEYPGLDDHWTTSGSITIKEAAINPDFSDFQA